jgi:FkbM family methyltransferase
MDALTSICRELASAEVLIGAVGATPGKLELAAHPTHPHWLASPYSAPYDWVRFSVYRVTVDCVIELVRRTRKISATLVKIDVAGPEISVLEGSVNSLAEGRDAYLIEAALLDTDKGRFGEIVNFMSARDYEVFDIIEPLMRPADQVLWQVDLIFVPRGSAFRGDRRYH